MLYEVITPGYADSITQVNLTAGATITVDFSLTPGGNVPGSAIEAKSTATSHARARAPPQVTSMKTPGRPAFAQTRPTCSEPRNAEQVDDADAADRAGDERGDEVEPRPEALDEPAGDERARNRITSYNVCYTKLLRVPIQ